MTPSEDICCGELGAPEIERWSEPAWLDAADRGAVDALRERRVLQTRASDASLAIAGTDQVGVIVLPSGRRVRIRPKIAAIVLLDWMAYLGDLPPLARWSDEPGAFAESGEPHALLARLFLEELEKLTRWSLRKGYDDVRSEGSTVRGRVLVGELARGYHRLPSVPQSVRARTLDTPHNRLLAAALDRADFLAPPAPPERPRRASLRAAWAGVAREAGDSNAAVRACREGAPAGYGPAVRLASIILNGASRAASNGTGGQSFLVSLSAFWERSLRRMITELRTRSGWSPLVDRRRTVRLNDGGGPREPAPGAAEAARWLTADAIVESGGRRWVLDAKYKRGFADEDRNDRFQMCAYALAFDAGRASLVYPTAAGAAGRSRVLLAGQVGGKPITIDSIELPMAAGPAACREALRAVIDDDPHPATPAGLG